MRKSDIRGLTSTSSSFEMNFDNFKAKRRKALGGKYFSNVKQFFNGYKSRVRNKRDRYESIFISVELFMDKSSS